MIVLVTCLRKMKFKIMYYEKQYIIIMRFLFYGFFVGWFLHNILDLFDIPSLQTGVDFYAEVHQSFWNALIHTFFMLGTMLGMFLWVPALLNCNIEDAKKYRNFTCCVYIGHYIQIDFFTTFLVCLWYYKVYKYSEKLYETNYRKRKSNLLYGLLFASVSLFIQETLGHYIGGDPASRLTFWPIFNAVLYAPYFSIAHLL